VKHDVKNHEYIFIEKLFIKKPFMKKNKLKNIKNLQVSYKMDSSRNKLFLSDHKKLI